MLSFIPKLILRLLPIILLLQLSSCSVYRQNVMFRTEGEVNTDLVQASVAEANRNYKIQPNDVLSIRIYTNKGELLVDPNNFLQRELSQSSSRGGGNFGAGGQGGQQQERQKYTVLPNGEIKVPMIGYINVQGLSLNQADSLFQNRFETYYRDTYVYSEVISRRVVVLGGTGGQVIPLPYENMNLVEVLALSGGMPVDGKAQKIRLIRNISSNHPIVQVVDLSTIAGVRKANLQIQPNDVVYVEPVRRVFTESLRDVLTVISGVTSILTSYVLITNL